MRKIYLIILLFVSYLSCAEYPDPNVDIATVVSIPNNGFQQVKANRIENGIYKVSIYKGGYNTETITAELDVDLQLLTSYNNKNGTNYELLPEKYYTFDNTVELSGNKYQESIDVKFDIEAIITDNVASDMYVLPLRLMKPAGKISETANNVIINIDLAK